jgi:hypothetical protein
MLKKVFETKPHNKEFSSPLPTIISTEFKIEC